MGAPSPELCNPRLTHAFNARDTDAAAALYHPEAPVVQLGDVHGGSSVARGADRSYCRGLAAALEERAM